MDLPSRIVQDASKRPTLLWVIVALAMAVLPATAQPPKLIYSTYVGTGLSSRFGALAVDSAGFSYIGGTGPSEGGSSGPSIVVNIVGVVK